VVADVNAVAILAQGTSLAVAAKQAFLSQLCWAHDGGLYLLVLVTFCFAAACSLYSQ